MKPASGDSLLTYESMKAYPGIGCFSTTRHGGCSRGNYATFNCNAFCGDEAADVARNRETLCRLLAPEELQFIIPHQTHGTEIRIIDAAFAGKSPEERETALEGIDALTTNLPGYVLCISTADCLPVLLYDATHRAVAAIHAGWRGTVSRIVEHTLARMATQYGTEGKEVAACIGPGISQEAFEVGDEVYEAFREAGFEMKRIARQEAKWHIDLREANRLQLLAQGVNARHIDISGICTYARFDDFFSARRLGIRSGRILSGIWLRKSRQPSGEPAQIR